MLHRQDLRQLYGKGGPSIVAVGTLLPGVGNGVQGMRVGGQRVLGIPAAQAYKAASFPPFIGPNESLWVVVEILEATP